MERIEDDRDEGATLSLEQRITRNLIPGRALEIELAVFATLSPSNRTKVEERLIEIDQLLHESDRTSDQFEKAAAKLGTSTRNLYRLLERMKAVGPVGGLAPGFRALSRSKSASSESANIVRQWTEEFLQTHPSATASNVLSHLQKRAAQEDIEIKIPPLMTLHKHVQSLRAEGLIAPKEIRPVGNDLVLDQTAINMTVDVLEGKAAYAVATLLLDEGTGLVLGVGLTAGDGIGMGIESAISDAIRFRLPALVEKGAPIAARLERFNWIVPPGLENVSHILQTGADDLDPRPLISVTSTGPRRHGVEIVRVLGNRLGQFEFRTRATQRQHAASAAIRKDFVEQPESANASAAATAETVIATERDSTWLKSQDPLRVLRYAADRWNEKRLARAGLRSLAREQEEEVKRADALGQSLRVLFEPVMTAIEERFEPTIDALPRRSTFF